MQSRLAAVIVAAACVAALSASSDSPASAAGAEEAVAVSFDDWRFRRDSDGRGLSEGWAGMRFDDSQWGPIEVPAYWSHTWIGGYLGYGWYRARFEVPEDAADARLTLEFGSVDEQAWVFVNGRIVGEHTIASEDSTVGELWNSPFVIEVDADHLQPGDKNVLAVLVHASTGDGGIWLPVVATLQ